MRPVCVRCRLQFAVQDIGVTTTECAGSKPYKLYNGDLWKCPGCGFEVVGGFGLAMEYYERDFKVLRARSRLDWHASTIERDRP